MNERFLDKHNHLEKKITQLVIGKLIPTLILSNLYLITHTPPFQVRSRPHRRCSG
jgi:cell shape-determining protein MreD